MNRHYYCLISRTGGTT